MPDQSSVGLECGAAPVNSAEYLPCNGHLKVILIGQLHHHSAGLDALGNHMHLIDDFRNFSSLAQLHAHVPISTPLAHASRKEISHSREAGKVLG